MFFAMADTSANTSVGDILIFGSNYINYLFCKCNCYFLQEISTIK